MFPETRTKVQGRHKGVSSCSRLATRRGNFHLIGPLYRGVGEAKTSFRMSALQFIVENEPKYVVEKKRDCLIFQRS